MDICKLGDIAKFTTGKLNSNAAQNNGRYPFFTCAPESLRIDEYAFDTEAIILAGNNAEGNFHIQYFKGKFNAYQRTYVIESLDENKVYTKYLYYALKTCLLHFKQISQGSATKFLTTKILNSFELPIPEINIQKKVAGILGNLDEKIEANTAINENLEQQAQAIFANMFDESNTTQATISDVSLNVTDGVHNTVHDDPEGEYLLLSCKNIKGGSLNIGTSERRISRDTFEKLRRRTKLSKGDVLISSVGTIGELLLLNNESLNYEFQRSVAMVKPNPAVVSSAYLYESLLSNRAKLINSAHGAVQQCLFISDIAEFPIRIPQQDILSEFDTIVTPMLDIVTANENENIKLSQLRDTLLPKLMSGEIDVSDLEF